MTAKAKVLFIGLDGAEPHLVREWTESGVMPVLQSFRERAVWGATTTPLGCGNGVMWPSLFTGVNPAKHGRYFSRQVRPGSYHATPFREDTDFKREPLWQILSRAGRRVAVIDMVRAPLTMDLNGITLVDWMTQDRTGPTRSWPPELTSEVTARFGTDPLGGSAVAASRTADEYAALCRVFLERVETKTEMSRYYLDQGNWDLFITVYADSHDVGHQCWHIHDPAHPWHDPSLLEKIGDPIKEVYVRIDAGIGSLVEQVGPETTVIVFAGLGMGPAYTGNFLLDQILRRLEYGPGSSGLTYVDTIKSIYRRMTPAGIRTHIRQFAQRREEALLAADRSRRQCFAVPHNENSGAIRINLVGREPNGKVNPGPECDVFCEALTRDLMDLVNLDNGEPLVEEVVRVKDHFEGEYVDELPDLLAIWHRTGPISAVGSPKVGEIRQPYPGSQTGDHTPRGLFYAWGPNVHSGELSEPVSVMDIGATITALRGAAMPGADGKPIAQVGVTDWPAESRFL